MGPWQRLLAATLAVALTATVSSGAGLPEAPSAMAAPPSGPAYNPVSGNEGFLVFVEDDATLNTSAVTAGVALGGNLTMSGINLALGQSIVASSTSGSLAAMNANDGLVDTYWQSSDSFPQTLTVDLGSSRTTDRIVLRLPTAFATRTQTLSVLGSLDGTSYSTIVASDSYTFDPGTGNEVTINFPSTSQRFLRLNITANTAVGAGQISEFEVYPPAGSIGDTFAVASQTAGTFTASGDSQPTGLLVGGRMNWTASGSNGYVEVRSSGYVKLGDLTGTDISQSTGDPTQLVPTGAARDSRPRVALLAEQPTGSVGQSGLVDFSTAFSTYRSRSSELATCDNTVVLRDNAGTPLPDPIPPGTNAFATLTPDTQNVLNISASNLNNVNILTLDNQPNATTPLIVNVDTTGVGDDFTWLPFPINGIGDPETSYIMWNFATANRLMVSGSNAARGTIYAPRAGVYAQIGNGMYGNVIARSYAQGAPAGGTSGGDVRNLQFDASVQSCLVTALDLSIEADTASIVEGGTVHYTVTIANTGDTPHTGISVTNSLAGVVDDATYNDDAIATAGTVDLDGTTLTWVGDLAVTEEVTITYSVTVNVPAEGDDSLVNVVTSSAAGSSCPPPGTDPGCTVTTNIIEQTLTLTDLTPSFSLLGTPGSTVEEDGVVTMVVTTNSPTGYQVTVQAASGELVNTAPGSTSSIPIGNLRVRETGTIPFQSLSATEPVVVHSQDVPSAPEGDELSNDYQATAPLSIDAGPYVGTLNYVAIAGGG